MPDNDLSKLRIEKPKISSRRKTNKRYGLLIFLLLMIIGAGVLYKKGILTPAVEVQTAIVQNIYPSQTFTLLNASGYVVAQRKAALASKITSRLVFLAVEEGARVKAGDVIARLENDDSTAARDRAKANVEAARSALDQAKADLDNASVSYNRNNALLAQRTVTQAEYDNALAKYKIAKAVVNTQQAAIRASEAALREAEVLLGYSEIKAPFDGVVLTKNADVGDIVTPLGAAANAKASVVTIADMDSLQVEADVSESNIGQVKIGQPCELRLDALPDVRLSGKVHTIVPTADRSKASVMVKIAFIDKNPKILPEMDAKVAFLSREVLPEETKFVKTLLSSAIITQNKERSVFVVKDNIAAKRAIRIGRQLGTMSEVLDGIDAGERIVISPPDKMTDGIKVKISE